MVPIAADHAGRSCGRAHDAVDDGIAPDKDAIEPAVVIRNEFAQPVALKCRAHARCLSPVMDRSVCS